MSFAEPRFLLAVLAIPLIALLWRAQRHRRRRYALRHPGAAVVARVLPSISAWRRRVPPALLALAAAALSVAIARPQATIDVPVERASVVLVTDESGSMLADDVQPTRLQAAQSAAESFVDEVPDELLVGAVSYSTTVETMLDPTAEHERVRAAVAGLEADGGTATGDALTAALDRLEARKDDDGSTAPAAIVLLSDGKTTQGSDPLAAADRAAKLGIPVFTVALGTPEGEVAGPNGERLAVPPDPETLGEIAERSGGRAFAVDDADALEQVYEDLGSRIGTRPEQREIAAAFAGAGLLLLLGGLGTGLRWRGRIT